MISGESTYEGDPRTIRGTINKKTLKVSLQFLDDDDILFYMWGKLSADFKKITG